MQDTMLRQNIIITERCQSLRQLGRNALRGKWRNGIMTMIVFVLCMTLPVLIFNQLFGMNMANYLTTEGYTYNMDAELYQQMYNALPQMSILSSVWVLLISGPMTLGLMIYFLASFRGHNVMVKDVFLGFERFGKALGLFLFQSLFIFLWTLLFIVPQRDDSYMDGIPVLIVLAGVLILTLLYYPSAGLMIARAMEEAKEKLPPSDSARRPMKTFSDGYSIFLTLFAVFVLIASANGWWTTFDYVFSGRWSRGLHLYSAWAALFVLTVTLCCVILIRHTLGCLEKRLSTGGRTVARLVGSLIGYVAVFFLIFSILGMVGVDTKVLLASAGVVSIAVGMGSQSMASDLLAGFFMMLEGSIHVGDQVTVGGSRETATGKVVDMGVRTIKILEETGNLVTMNNSKATPIKNLSQGRELPESEDKPEDKPEKKQENGSQKAD